MHKPRLTERIKDERYQGLAWRSGTLHERPMSVFSQLDFVQFAKGLEA
jgi:hypothetical protein